MSRGNETDVTGYSAETRKKLQTYGWLGNVEELKNTIRKAVLLRESDPLKAEDLDMPAENTADGLAWKAEIKKNYQGVGNG